MKQVIALVTSWLLIGHLYAQECDTVKVNLKRGTVNGLTLKASQENIKEKLPCFTGDTEDGSDYNCGGGVFFLENDFFFYSGRDYVEFREKFNGQLSVPVLGLTRAAAVKKLALGKPVRTQQNGDNQHVFFKTRYGCLRLRVEAGKVTLVAMHAQPVGKVVLCL